MVALPTVDVSAETFKAEKARNYMDSTNEEQVVLNVESYFHISIFYIFRSHLRRDLDGNRSAFVLGKTA